MRAATAAAAGTTLKAMAWWRWESAGGAAGAFWCAAEEGLSKRAHDWQRREARGALGVLAASSPCFAPLKAKEQADEGLDVAIGEVGDGIEETAEAGVTLCARGDGGATVGGEFRSLQSQGVELRPSMHHRIARAHHATELVLGGAWWQMEEVGQPVWLGLAWLGLARTREPCLVRDLGAERRLDEAW